MARSLSGGQSPIGTADLVAGLIRADAAEPAPAAPKGARGGKGAPGAAAPGRRQTTVTMPEEYHRALDLRLWSSRGEGLTKSQIFMEALDAYLADELETARRLGES